MASGVAGVVGVVGVDEVQLATIGEIPVRSGVPVLVPVSMSPGGGAVDVVAVPGSVEVASLDDTIGLFALDDLFLNGILKFKRGRLLLLGSESFELELEDCAAVSVRSATLVLVGMGCRDVLDVLRVAFSVSLFLYSLSEMIRFRVGF